VLYQLSYLGETVYALPAPLNLRRARQRLSGGN